jgi:hypothetical protein
VVGSGECDVEESWFCASELEVRGANGPKPQSGTRRCVLPGTYFTHAVTHTPSQNSERLVADRGEERIPVSEVTVRSVGDNANHARHLTQDYRVRAA